MYLLQAMRAASSASLDTFSFSQLTKCTHHRCESWGLAHPCRIVTLDTACSWSADSTLLGLQRKSQQPEITSMPHMA
jgi:hypothetical protein